MAEKIGYKTKQREELLEYLETVPGVHITVNDMCDFFRQNGRNIGTTTVYRQLERMVDDGLVSKYIIDGNSPACFEYLGQHVHEDHQVCFHCKCEKCGRLIHMHCDELNGIKEHLEEHHGFRLNSMRTVFYGICEDCEKSVKEEE